MGVTSRILLLCSLLACALASGSLAQSPLPAGDVNVAADRARSDALTPEQREQARTLFEHAYELLQSGDYQAARLGFEQGLAIDPANVVGSLYMAETLSRLGDNAGARTFYDKVIAIDANSAEALKAQAALKSLPATTAAMVDVDAAKNDAANRVVLFVAATSPIKTSEEAIAYIRANAKAVIIGAASPQAYGAAERFRKFVGLENPTIPYRTPVMVISEISGGLINFGILPMTTVLQPVTDGKIRAIAVTGPKRSVNMSQIPTMSELGISGL